MPKPNELPQLVKEFTDLSREYLLQETVLPAKQLGRYTLFALAGSVAFAAGTLLLSIAGVRWLVAVLPNRANYKALGYLIVATVLAIVAMIVLKSLRADSE